MATTLHSYQTPMKTPYVRGISRRYPKTRVQRAVRAANIRKWLAFAPSHVTELAAVMGCSRFALYHTLHTMPDVHNDRGRVTLKAAA